MHRSAKLRYVPAVVAAIVLFLSLWVGLADPADASCWECKYKYFNGGGFMDPWLFAYCGLHDGPGAWDCYVIGDSVCIEYGACEDFISV